MGRWSFDFVRRDLGGGVVDFDPARSPRAVGWSIGGCWGAKVLGVGFFLGLLDEVVYEAFGFFGGHFASIDKFVSQFLKLGREFVEFGSGFFSGVGGNANAKIDGFLNKIAKSHGGSR